MFLAVGPSLYPFQGVPSSPHIYSVHRVRTLQLVTPSHCGFAYEKPKLTSWPHQFIYHHSCLPDTSVLSVLTRYSLTLLSPGTSLGDNINKPGHASACDGQPGPRGFEPSIAPYVWRLGAMICCQVSALDRRQVLAGLTTVP